MKLVKFNDVKDEIRNGDILLYKGRGWISYFIQLFGQSPYSHVGMAARYQKFDEEGPSLSIVEFREFKGSREVNLESQLSVPVDVFRPVPYLQTEHCRWFYKPYIGLNFLRCLTGQSYSYEKILVMVAQRLPLIRWFVRQYYDDSYKDKMYVCSTAVAEAINLSYVSRDKECPDFDMMPFKSSAFMEPGDLARSVVLEYLFTLEPQPPRG